jgi:hypothetical protein
VLFCVLAVAGSNKCFAGSPGKMPVAFRHSALTLSAPADLTVPTDQYSNVATGVNLGQPVAGGDEPVVTSNAPAWFPIGTSEVIWTATDKYGNKVSATQKVTVVDLEKPFLSSLGEIGVVNDAGGCGAKVELMIPYAFDNSGQVAVTNDAPGTYFPVGTTLITWTATDPSGNTDTMTQRITVIDNELPVCHLASSALSFKAAAGQCGVSLNLDGPTATDNCGIASITSNAPAVFPVGTTIVTWTVTDLGGYEVRLKQSVTIVDSEAPSMQVPASISMNTSRGASTSTINLAAPSATDNCGIASISNDAPAAFPVGTTVVTWTATDLSGNKTTATQLVTVNDTEAPVFTAPPADITVSCENVPPASTPAVTDNADPAPVVSLVQTSTQGSNVSQASRYNYVITRNWTATDNAGNTSAYTQKITVVDKTAPVINAPDFTVPTDPGVCSAVVRYAVSASDNSGGAVTLSYSKPNGSKLSTGSTAITVTAKDVSGNIATKTFVVTVADKEAPAIKPPANISVTVSSGSTGTSSINLGKPATSDNCGVKSVANDAPSFYPVGITTVTWTATDLSGNISKAVQYVTVSKRRSNAVETGAQTQSVTAEGLDVALQAGPNPSAAGFTVRWQSRLAAPVTLRVYDMTGKLVEGKSNLAPSGYTQIGAQYQTGMYIAEMLQGNKRTTIRLLKIK